MPDQPSPSLRTDVTDVRPSGSHDSHEKANGGTEATLRGGAEPISPPPAPSSEDSATIQIGDSGLVSRDAARTSCDTPNAPSLSDGSGSYVDTVCLPHPLQGTQPQQETGVHVSTGNGSLDATGATDVGRGGAAAPMKDDTKLSRAQSPRQEEDGLRCGRYVLKRFHARGGMGEVWEAEDPVIGRQVALKRMSGRRSEQFQRFEVEAQVTGQLEHPGIVPIHELGYNDDGQPYYVMKFLHGKTLHQVIKDYHELKATNRSDREVEQFRLLQIFTSLCQTVAYAHSRGVVHRDLKPDNVMQGEYGETILLDWGIAKIMGQPDRAGSGGDASYVHLNESSGYPETRAGTIMGTPMYMAPEIATGRNEEVDHRSDVFLLGAILYEILTGHQPRSAKTAYELIQFAKAVPAIPPSQICPDVPKPLDAICRKAMALAKTDRYQTALSLAEDVQRFMAGEPVSAYPERLPARAWRWAKRHRKALGRTGTVASILAVVLFGAVRVREAERETKQLQSREVARREVSEFRRLADEARFFSATTDPVSEHAPYFDPRRGDGSAKSALHLASRWGTNWERLPLNEERASLRHSLNELHHLLAHHSSAAHKKDLEDVQRSLDSGQTDNATALDYFLLGESYRRTPQARSVREVEQEDDGDRPERLERAIEAYRKALEIDPNDYWSHFQLGRCYIRLGRFAEGVEALGSCVALRPQAPWGYSVRGLALAMHKQYDKAEKDLNRAVSLAPDFRPARLNRGVVFWLQGDREGALADFEAVLKPPAERRLIEAAYYRAQLYLQGGEVAKALEDFDSVVAENPNFLQVYRVRARVRLALGEKSLAFQDLDQYLGLTSEGMQAAAKGRASVERGHTLRYFYVEIPHAKREEPAGRALLAAALEELQKAVREGEQTPALFDDLGVMLEHASQTEEAISAYTKGLDLAPRDNKLRMKRAWCYQRTNHADEALADFGLVLQAEPENAEAHSGLGYLNALRKRPSDAQREADLALLFGGDDHRVLHNVACVYAALSEIALRQAEVYQEVAISLIRKAITRRDSLDYGPDEIDLIQREPAFQSLRSRGDFQQLLQRKDTEPGRRRAKAASLPTRKA